MTATRAVVPVVGAAIRRDDGAILAALRSSEMSTPNQWEFPGGKVEPGETHGECLVRELREELAVDIEVGEHVGLGVVDRPGRQIRLDVYECRILAGVPTASEHAELRWVSPDELPQLDWAEADMPIVRILASQ